MRHGIVMLANIDSASVMRLLGERQFIGVDHATTAAVGEEVVDPTHVLPPVMFENLLTDLEPPPPVPMSDERPMNRKQRRDAARKKI